MCDDERRQGVSGPSHFAARGWVGTGLMVTLAVGTLTGMPIEQTAHGAPHGAGGMHFVRIGGVPPGNDTPAAAGDAKHVVVDNFSFTPAWLEKDVKRLQSSTHRPSKQRPLQASCGKRPMR